jgi:hypothetical protein
MAVAESGASQPPAETGVKRHVATRRLKRAATPPPER